MSSVNGRKSAGRQGGLRSRLGHVSRDGDLDVLETTLRSEIDDMRGLADELVISLLLLDPEDPSTVFRVIEGQRERLSRFEKRVRDRVAHVCTGDESSGGDETRRSPRRDSDRPRRRGGTARRLDAATAVAAAVAAVLAIVSMGSGTSSRLLSGQTGPGQHDDRLSATGQPPDGERDVGAPNRSAPATSERGNERAASDASAGLEAGAAPGLQDVSVLEPFSDLLSSLLDVTRIERILARFLDHDGQDAEVGAGLPTTVPAESRHSDESDGGEKTVVDGEDGQHPDSASSDGSEPASDPDAESSDDEDGTVGVDVPGTVPSALHGSEGSSRDESSDDESEEPDDADSSQEADEADESDESEEPQESQEPDESDDSDADGDDDGFYDETPVRRPGA